MNSVNQTELCIRPALSACHYAMLVASVRCVRPAAASRARVATNGRTSNMFIRVEGK
jgi:hypothetical protein